LAPGSSRALFHVYFIIRNQHTTQLGGTTAWGLRLFFQVGSVAAARGRDDERYNKDKLAPSFWSKATVTQYLPEALFQTLITLPVAAALRQTRVELVSWGWTDLAAVGLFSAGYALEVLADSQKKAAKKAGVRGIYRDGVWKLVRHPK
jgi:steroid 5-alpha reductase family enzyme